MQPLKNERHEAFAQMVALGSSHTAAYIAAGYNKRAANPCAARLLAKASVNARVRYLQAHGARQAEVTMESLISDAQRCRDLGIWHGQINAAVLAVKELGILSGFRVEKRVTQRIDPATISDEELAAIIRSGPTIDGEAIRQEARARLEAPQPAENDGRNAGISREAQKENATISRANGPDAEPGRGTAPAERASNAPIRPQDIPLDRPVAPGTIEKAIRAIRGRPTRSRPAGKSDVKSKG